MLVSNSHSPASAFLMLGGQACASIPILLFCFHHGITEAERNEFYTFITSASNRVSSPGWPGIPYSRENDLESVVRLLPLPQECCHTQYTVWGTSWASFSISGLWILTNTQWYIQDHNQNIKQSNHTPNFLNAFKISFSFYPYLWQIQSVICL